MAIGITFTKAKPGYDLGASKFFGTPTIPAAWENTFTEDEIFFCQLRLAELAALDTENCLPHTGYLYVFLHTEGTLQADVRYNSGEPELALEDFNAAVPGYERYCQDWLMTFAAAEEDLAQTRLLGVPADWPYEHQPPKLLLQYDPLDNKMGFLDALDGFLYLFFGENTDDFSAVTLHTECS